MDNNPTPTAQATPQPQAPSPVAKNGNNKMMIIIGALILIIVGLGGFMLMNNTSQKTTPTPTPVAENTTTTPDEPNPSQAMTNGTVYTSSDKKWQVTYPTDATAEKREAAQIGPAGVGEVAVIYKLGPTQTSGTEFHDGYSVTVGTMKKPAATTLQKFADDQINPNPEAPVTKTPYQNITINGLSGIWTVATGMSTFKFVYLQAPNDPELVYYVAILAEGADKTAYQAATDQILESLKLL